MRTWRRVVADHERRHPPGRPPGALGAVPAACPSDRRASRPLTTPAASGRRGLPGHLADDEGCSGLLEPHELDAMAVRPAKGADAVRPARLPAHRHLGDYSEGNGPTISQ